MYAIIFSENHEPIILETIDSKREYNLDDLVNPYHWYSQLSTNNKPMWGFTKLVESKDGGKHWYENFFDYDPQYVPPPAEYITQLLLLLD